MGRNEGACLFLMPSLWKWFTNIYRYTHTLSINVYRERVGVSMLKDTFVEIIYCTVNIAVTSILVELLQWHPSSWVTPVTSSHHRWIAWRFNTNFWNNIVCMLLILNMRLILFNILILNTFYIHFKKFRYIKCLYILKRFRFYCHFNMYIWCYI